MCILFRNVFATKRERTVRSELPGCFLEVGGAYASHSAAAFDLYTVQDTQIPRQFLRAHVPPVSTTEQFAAPLL